MKTCTACKVTKLVDAFYHVNGSPMHNCKACKNKKDNEYYWQKGGREKIKNNRKKNIHGIRKSEKEWRDKNPEYLKGKTLQKYWPGVSWRECLDRFLAMLSAQNNLCAICSKPETCLYNKSPYNNKVRDLCVDHCHKTGKVRGLLCDGCNVLIARAKDQPDVCRSAAQYLEAHNEALSGAA